MRGKVLRGEQGFRDGNLRQRKTFTSRQPTAVRPVAPLAVEKHAPDRRTHDDGLLRAKGRRVREIGEMREIDALGGAYERRHGPVAQRRRMTKLALGRCLKGVDFVWIWNTRIRTYEHM